MENLPLGYRFYPTEEELVHFYLRKKLDGMRSDLNQLIQRIIPTLDIYEFNPWDLPQFSGEACQGDSEQWFFFIPRKESEARGGRPNRLTTFGYWKATGSPGYVYSSGSRIIGFKRTMVFYKGRAPRGNKTDWKMNEYMAFEGGWDHESSSNSSPVPYQLRQEYSVCRVYMKTKSLRAFDRRPTADVGGDSNYLLRQVFDGDLQREEATTTPTDRDHCYQHHQMTCNHGINPPQEVERTVPIDSSSPDSSSSFDEVGHGDQMAGCINDEPTLAMDDIDTIWGWIEGSVDAN